MADGKRFGCQLSPFYDCGDVDDISELGVNSLVIDRVSRAWGEEQNYHYDYHNIAPHSVAPTGDYMGINQVLNDMTNNAFPSLASAVLLGESKFGLYGDSYQYDVLAEVRAKFHGGTTGGFDTKFPPYYENQCQDWNPTNAVGDSLINDIPIGQGSHRCMTNSLFPYPNKCGYFEEYWGMGGICDSEAGCDGTDYSVNSYLDYQLGTGGEGGVGDWDGLNHTPWTLYHSDYSFPEAWLADDWCDWTFGGALQ